MPSVLIPANRVPLSAYAGRQHPSRPQGWGWSGLPGDLRQWAGQVVEKVRVASVGGRLRFLPWFDPYTEETPEMRAEYRHMLREPSIKAAVQTKALSVISEEIQFQPEDDDDPRQQEAAQFLSYAFRHVSGGTRQLGWSVLLAAIIDGHSVCEKVWCPEPLVKGRFRGKRIFHAVKCKDTHFLQLGIDPYRNLTALKGTGFNAGRVWSPSDFVTFSYFSLFENPAGMSDFRAAYRAYWIKDTTWKLRSLHLEKWTGPFITGQYGSPEQKAALEAAFEEARASTWLTIPAGAVVEAMDLAMKGTSDFKDAIQDCDREMLIAIVGAHLQILEGQTGGARGNTKIHKEIGELIQWWLAATLADVYQQQVAVPLIEENYHDVEVPACTVGAITDEDILGRAKVYEAVQKIGIKLSKKAVYRNLSLQPPDPGDPDDTLEPPGQGGGGPGQPPAGAGPEGGGEGGNPFAEARRFCQEGPNKGKPGPCPEDVDRHHVAATAHHAAARAAHKEAAKHSRAAAATTEKRTGDPLRDVPRWASKDLDEIQQLAGGGAGKSDPQKLSQAVTRADQLLSRLEPLADTNPGAARAAEKLRATRDAARRALANYTAAHESRQAARQAQAGREAPLQEAVDRHAAVLTSGDDWGTILEGDLYGPDVNALESALRDFEHAWKPREQKEAAGRVKKTAAAVAAAHAGQAEHAASVAAARNLALAASRLLPALDKLEAVRRHAEGWQAFCQEGPNKGKPGPCPEPKFRKESVRDERRTSHLSTEQLRAEIKGITLTPEQDSFLNVVYGMGGDALRAMPERERIAHGHAIHAVVSRMPKKALKRLAANVNSIRPAATADEVTEEWKRDTGGDLRGYECILGFYDTRLGALWVDGGETRGVEDTQRGVWAHEMGHAIDGHKLELSASEEWKAAFAAEIEGGNLSTYATTSAIEGFAEFCRAAYGTDVPLKKVEAMFPKCVAFFKKRGLL